MFLRHFVRPKNFGGLKVLGVDGLSFLASVFWRFARHCFGDMRKICIKTDED